MIVYSIMPEEVVFNGMEGYTPEYMEIEHNGVTMQLEPINGQQARIVRLFSNNPQDYLNPGYMPGTIVEYNLALPKS